MSKRKMSPSAKKKNSRVKGQRLEMEVDKHQPGGSRSSQESYNEPHFHQSPMTKRPTYSDLFHSQQDPRQDLTTLKDPANQDCLIKLRLDCGKQYDARLMFYEDPFFYFAQGSSPTCANELLFEPHIINEACLRSYEILGKRVMTYNPNIETSQEPITRLKNLYMVLTGQCDNTPLHMGLKLNGVGVTGEALEVYDFVARWMTDRLITWEGKDILLGAETRIPPPYDKIIYCSDETDVELLHKLQENIATHLTNIRGSSELALK